MQTLEKLSDSKVELEKLLNLDINEKYKKEANRIINIYESKVKELTFIVKDKNFLIDEAFKKHLEIKGLLKELVKLCYRFEEYEKLQTIIDSIKLKEVGIIFILVNQGIERFTKKKSNIQQQISFLEQTLSFVKEQEKVYLDTDNNNLISGFVDFTFYVFLKINFLIIQLIEKLEQKNKGFKIDKEKETRREILIELHQYKKQIYDSIYSFITFSRKNDEDIIIALAKIPWEVYEAISKTMGDASWCQFSYLDGVLELVANGEKHENFKGNIGDLIVYFCDDREIDYYNFGSKTEENKKARVSKEPDVSYGFYGNKKSIDLAVEINYSSGSIKDLEKYRLLKIKEVWMWDKKENILFFALENNQYSQIKTSKFLAPLTPEIIRKCAILMREKTSRLGKKEMIKMVKEIELNTQS
ncbi:MAG: Uma2 family endonuclease [Xenococcus sp. (in: cyanobacteria)]